MKNLKFVQVCVLGVLSMIMFACDKNESEVQRPNSVFLSGKVLNPGADAVYVKQSGTFGDVDYDTLALDENGTFYGVIKADEEGFYRFSDGNERATVYLVPGDSLHLELDTKEFDESLKFSGNGSAKINNYLAERVMMEETEGLPGSELYAQEYDDFTTTISNIKDKNVGLLATLKENYPAVSEKFLSVANANVLYDWANKMMNFESYHKHYAKKDSVSLPASHMDFLSQLDINNPALLGSSSFKSFIKNYLDEAVSKVAEDKPEIEESELAYFGTQYDLVDKNFQDSTVAEYLKASTLNDLVRYGGVNGVSDMMADFKSLAKDDAYVAEVDKQYSAWAKLVEGMPAPNFQTVDLEGNGISLADQKGKFVYIDVWATWCGPCRREIPHLEKLQEEYKDADIAFMSVSIDSNKEAWEKMVAEGEMKGIQVFIDGAWNSTLTNDYNIKGIPRFMIVDKEGNIVNANAARPSGKIKEVFDALLEEVEA